MNGIQLIIMMVNAMLASLFIQGYHSGYRMVMANLWFVASMCAMSFIDM